MRPCASVYGRALSLFFTLIAIMSIIAWIRNRGECLYLSFAIWLQTTRSTTTGVLTVSVAHKVTLNETAMRGVWPA